MDKKQNSQRIKVNENKAAEGDDVPILSSEPNLESPRAEVAAVEQPDIATNAIDSGSILEDSIILEQSQFLAMAETGEMDYNY